MQATILHTAFIFAKALAKSQKFATEDLTSPKMGVRRISDVQVGLLRTLRGINSQFKELTSGRTHNAIFPPITDTAPIPGHFQVMGGILNLDTLSNRLKHDFGEICGAFGACWSKDLTTVVEEVERSCPAWQPFRDTLMDNAEMVRTLKSNPAYGKIGRLCTEVKTMVKLVKDVHADNNGLFFKTILSVLSLPSHSCIAVRWSW